MSPRARRATLGATATPDVNALAYRPAGSCNWALEHVLASGPPAVSWSAELAMLMTVGSPCYGAYLNGRHGLERCSRMTGRTARSTFSAPNTFVSKIARACASETSSTAPNSP